MIDIEFAHQQQTLPVDQRRLEQAARVVLDDHGPETVHLSVAVVDDATIHALNRQFLKHDYPTDVLSFLLENEPDRMEGEVVISADTARAQAERLGVRLADELLLYLIHGVLHLVGFDDTSPRQRDRMRHAERQYMEQCGVWDHAWAGDDDPR
jgi:probable rRNA maturation factor